MLAALTWTFPWWGLAAAAAVALPVAAHLWSLRVRREIVLPTLRFLLAAEAQTQSPRRLRHWLLLMLRCGVLLLIVAALTQPVWHRGARALAQGDQSHNRHHILILDRSASMTRAARGVMLFERARANLLDKVQQLDPSRDVTSVVLLDARPRLLLPEPTANIALLADQLQSVGPTHYRGDLSQALALAQRLGTWVHPDHGPEPMPASITLLSDMQATQGRPTLQSLPGRLEVERFATAYDNIALHQPRIEPSQPIVGQSASLSVGVSFFSADHEAQRQVSVSARVGQHHVRQTAMLQANTTTTINVDYIPAQTGRALVRWRIEESGTTAGGDSHSDALPLDDEVGLFFEIAAKRSVTLVTQSDPNDITSAAYYMVRALTPGVLGARPDATADAMANAGADAQDHAGVALDLINPIALSDRLLGRQGARGPGIIVLLEAGQLDAMTLELLGQWIEAGGGLLWVIDSDAAMAALSQFASTNQGANASPLIPRGQRMTRSPQALSHAAFKDALLKPFEGPARSTLLGNTLSRWAPATATPDAMILLMLANDQPLLAMRWHGAGRLAVLAGDLAPGQSTLVTQPSFVPLVHQLVRVMAPGPPTPPNSHPEQAGREVGLYRDTTSSGSSDRASAGAGDMWVELHPDESDLRPLDEASLNTTSNAGAGASVGSVAGADVGANTSMSNASRTPSDRSIALWPWLLALAIALAFVEQSLAESMSRDAQQTSAWRHWALPWKGRGPQRG